MLVIIRNKIHYHCKMLWLCSVYKIYCQRSYNIVVILCNVKFNISIYGYRGYVVDTVNIPSDYSILWTTTCEVTECDVAKQCSMFRHNVISIGNWVKIHGTTYFHRSDFEWSAHVNWSERGCIKSKCNRLLFNLFNIITW